MELPLFLFSVVLYGSTVAQIRIQPPNGGTLKEGDELYLRCILEDPSFSNISWFKERVQLSESSTSLIPDQYNLTRSPTRTDDGLTQYVLQVQSVAKYNDGVYECKASMQNGTSSKPKKYELNVLYQPHSKYPLCNFIISEQLANCESEIGNPEILLQWRHQSTVSNSSVAIESQNVNVNKFMHNQTAYMYNFSSPLDVDDSIVCVLPTQPERNCSVSLRDIYDSFDPPTISSNMTVLATESANVSCSTNLNLANDEFLFQYETFPHNRSLVIVQDDRSITFTAIPVGIDRIEISCLFKWGIFDSLKSDLTFITVIQPTTTPNSVETSRKVNLRTTPSITTLSLLSLSQLPTQLPTMETINLDTIPPKKEQTTTPHNVSLSSKIPPSNSTSPLTELVEVVSTTVSVLPENSKTSPMSDLETIIYITELTTVTTEGDHTDVPLHKATTLAPPTSIKPPLSVKPVDSTTEQMDPANTLESQQSISTFISSLTSTTVAPANTPSKSSKTTDSGLGTTEFNSPLASSTEDSVLNSTMKSSEIITGSTFAKENATGSAITSGVSEAIGPSSTLHQKSWFQHWIIFPFALIIAMIPLISLCYVLRRKCTRYGQYKVVTKSPWVSNAPGTLGMHEIHL